MRFLQSCLALLLVLLGVGAFPNQTQAARGIPPSPEFGYGVRIDLEGEYLAESLQYAASLPVDWVGFDLDWAAIWPDPNSQPRLENLDQAMEMASRYELSAQISLLNAPPWARSGHSPEPSITSWFVANLVERYPQSLKAVELFPGANTRQDWGATPDAGAYLNLVKATIQAVGEKGIPGITIMPGLVTLPASQPSGDDIDDLDFLQQLYMEGAAAIIPVVSLNFSEMTGSPLQSPTETERRVLRHYEEIHHVMVTNQHTNGAIWISKFSWPSGTINTETALSQKDAEAQNQWMIQAFKQLRSQLYIGAAFLNSLNPSSPNKTGVVCPTSLIRTDASLHPFCAALKKLIAQNHSPVSLDFASPQEKHIYKIRPGPP